MTKSRPEIVVEVALSVPVAQRTDSGSHGAAGVADGQTTERRWYQLQLWGKPGGDSDLLSATPPTLPLGLIYRWSWRSWFVAGAVARVAEKGVPLARLGVEEWVRRTTHALLHGRASVWRAVVQPSPALRSLERQGLLPSAFLQGTRTRRGSSSGAAEPAVSSDSIPQARIDAVRLSIYDYKFQPLLGWPATQTRSNVDQPQLHGARVADAAAARTSSSSTAARSGGGSVGARRGIPLSPPLPHPYSTSGSFPQREAGSVWERTRLCTYYIAQRQDVQLSAEEIVGGGCFHVAPLVEEVPAPSSTSI